MGFILYIMFLHWLADFVFQTDEMAKNKSTSWKWLFAHIAMYTSVLFVGLAYAACYNLPAEFINNWHDMFGVITYRLAWFFIYTRLSTGPFTLLDRRHYVAHHLTPLESWKRFTSSLS